MEEKNFGMESIGGRSNNTIRSADCKPIQRVLGEIPVDKAHAGNKNTNDLIGSHETSLAMLGNVHIVLMLVSHENLPVVFVKDHIW